MIKDFFWKNRTYNYILQSANIKMIQIIAKLDETFNYIYWIWVDYTISIIIKIFDSCDFTKKHLDFFFKNKH
jgi:hypothetical protein